METDAELIRASHGDHARFDGLVRRHHAAIFRFAARRVGPEAAADVAQDTFIRAFSARERFRPSGDSAEPWLFGIAANVLREHGRRERRQLELLARAQAVEGGAAEGVPGVSADLLRAVRALARREREVLVLHAWGELSSEEIAVALDVPAATVRTRLHRARRRLRKRLGDSLSELRIEEVK